MEEKSLIKSRALMSKIISFDGLQVGKIYPSDIDFIWEIDNEFLIIGEVKTKDIAIPTGQKLLLERLITSWEETGKKGTAIRVSNRVEKGDIILKDCVVTDVFMGGKWHHIAKPKDVNSFIKKLVKEWDIKKLKIS